jgi:O-antigen/teichoic acid export membrane protein
MQILSKFFSDIIKSVSSSGVQFAIMMVTTPLMTRLYDPAAYSAFGVVHSIAIAVIGVGLLSLPNVYPQERDTAKRAALVQAMSVMLLVLVVLSAFASVVMAAFNIFDFGFATLALLPLLVATFGIRQIMVSVATECGDFNSLSLGQIVEPATARSGAVAFGILSGGHPAFILFSVAVGHLATAFTVAKMTLKQQLHQWRTLLDIRINPLRVLRQYMDFVVFNTASQQSQMLAMLAIQLLMVLFFSNDMGGQYILAISILNMPVSLVALATAPVLYRHFIEVAETNSCQLTQDVSRAAGIYLLVGFVIMCPLFFFGEEIFQFIFGPVWGPAGRIAGILSISYVGSFALIGVSSVFRVTRRLKLQFILELFTAILMVAVAALYFGGLDIYTAVLYLTIIWTARNVMMLVACIAVTRLSADDVSRVT